MTEVPLLINVAEVPMVTPSGTLSIIIMFLAGENGDAWLDGYDGFWPADCIDIDMLNCSLDGVLWCIL